MKNFIYREIAGDGMLIPTGSMVTKYNGLFMMTPTANIILKAISKGNTRDEIVDAVLEKFDADRETIEADVDTFLERLKEMEII